MSDPAGGISIGAKLSSMAGTSSDTGSAIFKTLFGIGGLEGLKGEVAFTQGSLSAALQGFSMKSIRGDSILSFLFDMFDENPWANVMGGGISGHMSSGDGGDGGDYSSGSAPSPVFSDVTPENAHAFSFGGDTNFIGPPSVGRGRGMEDEISLY